ncbi:glycoside hydrolase family 15 protein [Chelativorans salis]|uniref:Glycoside hydrolase family 15 protein n=1 Tax=Chelativorans salis TaxID=2978478 RepID=A0ABT2LR18_9HYPH|nr:glycoside hydrolase family 15 protein [Chelativorans sp. EGI FJ00035]MCT7376272.1 glycoside hydrolase family 15 protein [Chelativorans sp. EGI FJ00035]
MVQRIQDYALIGDCETAALVGKNGSIDWLCLPRFDSPACFAALLGEHGNGHWQIAPADPPKRITRRYRPESLVLETVFETAGGVCMLTDFMPVRDGPPTLVRIVTGIEGRVDLRMELVIRFDYGQLIPWVWRVDDKLIAIAGPDMIVLRTPANHHGEDLKTVADFAVGNGEEVPFVLSHNPSHLKAPEPLEPRAALDKTEAYWRNWAARGNYEGRWRESVVRSLITLKALTFSPTGGIIAAPTTSLPEMPGGTRNWDYRYCWLRDATFVLLSLMQAGYRQEAAAWRDWLARAVAGHPSQIQPLYSVTGAHRVDEWELPWVPGYGGAGPVRIGNAGCRQLQLDTFGEVLDALHHARRYDLAPTRESWSLQQALLSYLETLRGELDHGIWEVRGRKQHFTHSKVMMWVAFDRAVSAVEDFGLDGPADHWRSLRDSLHAEICERAFDRELGSFVQAYGSKQLDAATLLIPLVGFLPATDPRMISTVDAIGKRLMRDGFVHRYDSHETEDGLPPGEGVFLACTFWYIDNLILQGRHDEGIRMFEDLLAIRSDVGLLSEQYDVVNGNLLGNFPQALSHLALIDTAYNLSAAQGPARQRSKHRRAE